MTLPELTALDWRRIVDRVINAWGGYQLGVDFSSGGPETLAKDEGLKADDLEEWLNSILYTEFNLILDDDSVYPTSTFLIEALGYLKHNNRSGLDSMISLLPSVESIREANKKSRPNFVDGEEDMEIGDISEDDECELGVTGTSSKVRRPHTVTDEDGWTTILKK
ncbi:hypothetical protein GCK32_000477 [Trichostrongylus colubriformis]|uniref:Pre-rRNA-processing protein TSR2 homolog n=1 Tax=Trichostrongylus colubriformis TaxID=6319 RepID=A0AAN8IER5_TRICO